MTQLGTWRTVPSADLSSWNEHLLGISSHLHQYPFWNESLRLNVLLRPKYLVYREDGRERAFVAIISSGVPPAAFGLVRMGPVSLDADVVPERAMQALRLWARRHGFMFLRITHCDPQWLAATRGIQDAQQVEPCPMYPSPAYELRVPLFTDEEKVRASFQAIARRDLRKSTQIGYRIESTDCPEQLAQVWPIFLKMSQRKGRRFYKRSSKSYRLLIELARVHKCARLYTAYLGDRLVQAILVIRDHEIGHYIAGALDIDALDQRTSPSCLLHWTAMQDLIRSGATTYNLGLIGGGGLYIFKNKFRPVRVDFAPPLTIPTNPLFAYWMKVLPALPVMYSSLLRVYANRLMRLRVSDAVNLPRAA